MSSYDSCMTELLEKALAEVSKLPAKEQDALAAILLEEIADERLWAEKFARSQDKVAEMARKAREEFLAGKTRPFEP